MTKYLIITFSLFSIISSGQTNEDFVIKNYYTLTNNFFDFAKSSLNKTDIEKSIIINLVNDTSNHFCDEFVNIYCELLSNFHFIDLDDDNDLDVVFYGLQCAGFESTSVIVFINKNGKYKKCLNAFGRVVNFNPGNNMIVYQYPCCAETINTLINYKFCKDTLIENFGLTFFNSPILTEFSSDYDNIMPKILKKGNTHIIKTNSEIDFVPKDSLLEPTFIKINKIGTTNSEIITKSYATHVDSKGVIWYYCKIPCDKIKLEKIKLEYPFFAWVCQKYCS